MDSHKYHLLSEHFQSCADLPNQERKAYVSRLTGTDPELGRELESLLQYHNPTGAEPSQSPVFSRPPARSGMTLPGRRSRFGSSLFLIAAGAIATLAIVGLKSWALSRLEDHAKLETVLALRQNLDFRISLIRAWAERQKDKARRVVQSPDLIQNLEALLEEERHPEGLKERLLASPAYRKVSGYLLAAPPEVAERGFSVISPTGNDLCSESTVVVGSPVNAAGASYVRRVNLGEWFLSRPYPDRQYASGLTPDYEHPVMFVGGPVQDGNGRIVALVYFRFSPARLFQLLASSSSEVVAFDEKSVLLNPIENINGLSRAGLIPADVRAGGAFRVKLRDPRVDLDLAPPAGPIGEALAPTLMCRLAVEGRAGFDAEGHRDFRGREVLAAWSWLPEWDMGLGTQIPVAKVLTPLHPVRTAFTGLAAIPACMTLALLVASRFFEVRRRVRKENSLGSYQIERLIGKGGMAEVFLAHHAVLKRPAALKIMVGPLPDASGVERFQREARLASRLAHPNTIQIFEFGEAPDGRLFYAMEYISGVNIAQLLAIENPLPVARAVYLLSQIAGALEEAHQLGLLHRDLKPSNVMVCQKGGLADRIKVLDFGIACALMGSTEDMTRSTGLLGTPAYIAPERIQVPQNHDPRSDVYAFGALAFHLLTGRNAFEGAGPAEIIYQVMSSPRPSPSRFRGERLPEQLEHLVLDCLSINPDSRPQNFRAVEEAIRSIDLPVPWGQAEARAWWSANEAKVDEFIRATV